ncbi:hypothetical protein MRB53_024102 [Persea americana]|uniref:Uncharacterized protein n=1 Tax=Persea americana TaxID=3435 RepID=A0ACC2LCL7_PERAE|nr:hypothetical protein MRB53_024102 [Persea americana]
MSMAMASSSVSSKICFNQDCKEPKPDRWRTAWRLRTGDFAELCDRCASAYEEVRFCETFHSEASGWRNCESCGKRVHCGCIASMHAFTLLDMGGVECMTCARKNFITVPNQIWPSSTLPPLPLPERLKDISAKNWSQSTGSNSNPGQWWQPQSSWNSAVNQSDLHPRMPYEVDRLNSVDSRLISGEHPTSALENKTVKDPLERITSGSLKLAVPEGLANGNVNVDSLTSLNAFHKERNIDGLQDTGHLAGDNDPRDARKGVTADPLRRSVARMGFETLPSSCLNISLQSTLKDDSSLFNSAVSFSSPNEKSDQTRVSGIMSQRQMPPPPLAKQLFPNPQNVVDTPGELQAQMRCGRPRGDGQKRGQVLPSSNSVITPLFEKMLSASDAGRIGRLVLPKKCAEAYFPAISQPEGLPLKVQDAKGKDWLFQFRFWPNNNSRMYVLEGVTPCIQSMQLQAGDIVTFSRIDPEGKLLMGFRKASSVPSEQDVQAFKTGNGFSTSGEVSNKITKLGEPGSTPTLRPHKDGPGAKSSLCKKKSSLGSKNKRLRITHEDSLDLKLTWEEAQDILRPPPNNAPNIVVIEGYEFEEYKEAPVLGKPTLFTVNHAGEKHQWTQCEDCSKWRKLPLDALLPSRWTCSDNSWDLKRSSCSSAQELTTEQLEQLGCSNRASSKRTRAKEEIDTVEASEGLDTLANLAILGEGDALNSSTQPTTKHPRHRPGCSCIVCIQPPSGKGPKHKQTCTCNVCLTVKRRFRTLMLRREKRQSEKEAESARKKQELQPSVKPEMETEELASNHSNDDGPNLNTMASDGVCDDPSRRKSSSSPFKGHIDLNIQPEREEEPSPVSDSGSMMRLLRDAREFYPKQQTLENLVINRDLTINHMETIGGVGGQRLDTEPPGTTQPDVDVDHLVPVSMSLLASTSGTG